jgi:hypothetical protein
MGKLKKMRNIMRNMKQTYNTELVNCRDSDKYINLKSRVDLLENLLFEAALLSYKTKKEKKNG